MPSRISVCVPTYNGEAFLEECLAGLAAQTFEDFEVVVVDDCSSDTTVAIAQQWAARDGRFSVHVNPVNLGLVGNWNRCIALARGEWIKFMFQDDLIEPQCLEAMLAVGDQSGGFVACSRSFVFEEPCDPSLPDLYDRHRLAVEAIFTPTTTLSAEAYSRIKCDRMDINIIGEPTVTMIRKDLFDRYGLFDPMLVQICDSEMWTRLASNVGVTFIPEHLVAFRVHGASATGANRGRPFRGVIIDGIVETARFCTLPAFAAFRESARKAGRPKMLEAALATQLNIAFYMMRDAERKEPKDFSVRRELQVVMNQFGGFDKARNAHLWFRVKRMLGLASAVP